MRFWEIVLKDLQRYPKHSGGMFYALIRNDAFKYTFWLRACKYSWENILTKIFIFPICYIIHKHYKIGRAHV